MTAEPHRTADPVAGTRETPPPLRPGAGRMNDADLPAIRRTMGLILLVLITIGLYFAKDLILPLLIGALLALTLSPLVRAMQRRGIPPALTAIALIALLAFILAAAALLFSGPVSSWITSAPQVWAELTRKLQSFASSLAVMQQASSQVDQLTNGGSDPAVQRVSLEQPGLLTMAVSNAASILATTMVALVLALFLLASGDLFYVKLIDAFPRFGDKKRALRIVYGIERSVSRYLL
ncbi:MAG: AI-2E family transporter, partial [Gemmobacter sp.]